MSRAATENPNSNRRKRLLAAIQKLNLNSSDFIAEINPGTASTPGEHLRLSAFSVDGKEALNILKHMFRDEGIIFEEKQKQGGKETILVIRDVPDLGLKFTRELRRNFTATFALQKGHSLWGEGKFDLAQEQFFTSINAGNIYAPVSLARLLADRRSPYNNHQLVMNLVSLGAQLGDPGASAATLLSSNAKVAPEQGMKLYDQAIALEKSGKHQEAFKLYNQALLMGCTKAYADIGVYMLTGIHNMGIDNRELAIKYLEWGVAATEGNAMNALAKAYASGDVVEKNEERALELFKMAQQAGYESPNLGERIESLQNKVGRNHLHRIINSLHLHSDFVAEIHSGTKSTPGEHLRLSSYIGGYDELAALKIALDKAGIASEKKARNDGIEQILVIQNMPPLSARFEAQFKKDFSEALSQIKEAGLKRRVSHVSASPTHSVSELPKSKGSTKQETIIEQESTDMIAEKKELFAEIKKIQGQITAIVSGLGAEIPNAVFSKELKTHKRDALIKLNSQLKVTEKSSLDDLRACISKYREELTKCQGDAILRQGTIRKNCRTLIDSLSKDLENEQHVFNRLKR